MCQLHNCFVILMVSLIVQSARPPLPSNPTNEIFINGATWMNDPASGSAKLVQNSQANPSSTNGNNGDNSNDVSETNSHEEDVDEDYCLCACAEECEITSSEQRRRNRSTTISRTRRTRKRSSSPSGITVSKDEEVRDGITVWILTPSDPIEECQHNECDCGCEPEPCDSSEESEEKTPSPEAKETLDEAIEIASKPNLESAASLGSIGALAG